MVYNKADTLMARLLVLQSPLTIKVMSRTLLFFFCILVFSPNAFSQKQEVEKRISAKRFPSEALSQLADSFAGLRQVKYYLELNGADTSYEAKFKWKRARYSVEFLPNGSLMDVEKKVKFGSLPTSFQAMVEQQLGHDFKKFKVKKCQEQTRPGLPSKRYELEIEGKPVVGKAAVFEYLFEEDGAVVQWQEILLPSNNINLY